MSLFDEVSRHFAEKHLNVSKEWLEACISWCLEQNVSSVKNISYSQWLETDISVDGTQEKPLFPSQETLSSKLLPKKYTVQVQSCYDVATPAYSQLHKLKKSNLENASVCADAEDQNFKASWQPKPARMLYFVFHDGFKTLKGVEHESLINVLPDPILPGLKLTIQGPLDIRRGHIMLVKKSIKVLGGQVEEMVQNNNLINVLSTLLENPEHRLSNKFPECINFRGKPGKIKFVGSKPKGSIFESSSIQRKDNSNCGKRTPNPFDDDNDDIFSEMQIPNEELSTTSTPNVIRDEGPHFPFNDSSSNSISSQTNNFDIDFNDEFPAVEEAPFSRTQSIVHTVSVKPFQYLAMASREYGEIIIAKVCITTLSSKLSMKPIECSSQRVWHINVIITDGSDTIEAGMSPIILNKWIGFTPTEYAITFKNDPSKKEELKLSISSISNKLLKFNGIMKIKFHGPDDVPVIFEALNINPGHLQQFKKRQIV
ncbi:recQ-mediated genome instability protein 1 [Lepeophtheirus salmonis]|uniref:recQ-mediated genome instability protein 1 n=1 Tax=Lepeophtheirus salmonis TaxID=72036 RepID=UPI001AE908C7|nr:recQ-mediated genome instability protein 1-like [Lepeophtheirus salmonis]